MRKIKEDISLHNEKRRNTMIYDIAVAGAGVIGAMVARELTKYKLSVCVLEKENDVSCGASKANSGIVHGGYDPEPGTMKAKLNASGVEKLFSAAKDLNVPIKRIGSLVCAFGRDEDKTIKALYKRGKKNRIKKLKVLSGDKAREIEPNLSEKVTSALYVPTAGIVCPYELTIAAMGNAMDNGAELKTNFKIEKIEKDNGIFTIFSAEGEIVQAKYLVNCAGCHSDHISSLAGDDSFEIIPRAGEYLLLDKSEGERVNHTIFQVPSKEGKGILVTPTVDGNLLTGPTAEKRDTAEDRETTEKGTDTVMTLAKKSVPTVDFRSVITSFTGVRSSVRGGDFIIEESRKTKGLINVAAIDSPGLTACVAIAEYAVSLLKKSGLKLKANPDFDGEREDPHIFRKMNDEEKDAFIKQNPEYGKIVCRCETVSEGEIRAAIRRNPPARDMDAVKRRTRSGMGRCQGGFCTPYVMRLIAEENGMEMQDVTKNGDGSEMLTGRL